MRDILISYIIVFIYFSIALAIAFLLKQWIKVIWNYWALSAFINVFAV